MNDRNPTFDLQALRTLPISDVASQFGEVRRRGARLLTKCPWHDDTHPSLVLYDDASRGSHCHCFACGKHADNIAFVMEAAGYDFRQACSWLSTAYGISTLHGTSPRPLRPLPAVLPPEPAPKPTYTYIPPSFLQRHLSPHNSFCKALSKVFHPSLVEQLAEDYRLGTYEFSPEFYDDVIFPTIDTEGRIHNLKLQNYCTDPRSPQFLHCHRRHILWLGSELARKGIVPRDAVFDNKCLFGAHLLTQYPSATVALVESPKNALLGAAVLPQAVWVAAGSKGMLCEESLLALRGRRVVVYPDCDAIEDWKARLKPLRYLADFAVSDFCRKVAPSNAPKYDIADHILAQQGFGKEGNFCPL